MSEKINAALRRLATKIEKRNALRSGFGLPEKFKGISREKLKDPEYRKKLVAVMTREISKKVSTKNDEGKGSAEDSE